MTKQQNIQPDTLASPPILREVVFANDNNSRGATKLSESQKALQRKLLFQKALEILDELIQEASLEELERKHAFALKMMETPDQPSDSAKMFIKYARKLEKAINLRKSR